MSAKIIALSLSNRNETDEFSYGLSIADSCEIKREMVQHKGLSLSLHLLTE